MARMTDPRVRPAGVDGAGLGQGAGL